MATIKIEMITAKVVDLETQNIYGMNLAAETICELRSMIQRTLGCTDTIMIFMKGSIASYTRGSAIVSNLLRSRNDDVVYFRRLRSDELDASDAPPMPIVSIKREDPDPVDAAVDDATDAHSDGGTATTVDIAAVDIDPYMISDTECDGRPTDHLYDAFLTSLRCKDRIRPAIDPSNQPDNPRCSQPRLYLCRTNPMMLPRDVRMLAQMLLS
jgi:hypothetical protein